MLVDDLLNSAVMGVKVLYALGIERRVFIDVLVIIGNYPAMNDEPDVCRLNA